MLRVACYVTRNVSCVFRYSCLVLCRRLVVLCVTYVEDLCYVLRNVTSCHFLRLMKKTYVQCPVL